MKIITQKTKILKGTVIIPASKSQTIRGLILALLSSGISILKNPLSSQDTEDAIKVCKSFGAKVSTHKDSLIVKSSGVFLFKAHKLINSGNSGITTRFLLPIFGLRKDNDSVVVFDCGNQMRKRPIKSLTDALNRLGMNIKLSNNDWPLKIKGTLKGGNVRINGLTSQYLSALLLALPCASHDSIVSVKNLHERPYVEMTEFWLKSQGIIYSHVQEKKKDIYKIEGGQKYKSFTKTIPGDFSSASCVIAAAVLFYGKVVVHGLDMKDSQGDKELIFILKKMGADIRLKKTKIHIYGGKKLKGIKIDANTIPDLVPALAVIGTQATGKTEIINVLQARIKETDRLHSMASGLALLGAKIIEKKDRLIVYESKLRGNKVHGYNDHRTVMALSLAGMLATEKTEIDTAEAINKTFPNYVELMKKIGGKLQIKK